MAVLCDDDVKNSTFREALSLSAEELNNYLFTFDYRLSYTGY
jgi:hypothetical protein